MRTESARAVHNALLRRDSDERIAAPRASRRLQAGAGCTRAARPRSAPARLAGGAPHASSLLQACCVRCVLTVKVNGWVCSGAPLMSISVLPPRQGACVATLPRLIEKPFRCSAGAAAAPMFASSRVGATRCLALRLWLLLLLLLLSSVRRLACVVLRVIVPPVMCVRPRRCAPLRAPRRRKEE